MSAGCNSLLTSCSTDVFVDKCAEHFLGVGEAQGKLRNGAGFHVWIMLSAVYIEGEKRVQDEFCA